MDDTRPQVAAGKVLAGGPVEADLHLDVEIPSGATLTVDVSGTTVELTETTVASQRVSGGLRTVRVLIDRTSVGARKSCGSTPSGCRWKRKSTSATSPR